MYLLRKQPETCAKRMGLATDECPCICPRCMPGPVRTWPSGMACHLPTCADEETCLLEGRCCADRPAGHEGES